MQGYRAECFEAGEDFERKDWTANQKRGFGQKQRRGTWEQS